MARDQSLDTNSQFLSVDRARQLLPGTFEHALNHLLDHEVDLAHFDARFRNDTTGAPAYPPALLPFYKTRPVSAANRAHSTAAL